MTVTEPKSLAALNRLIAASEPLVPGSKRAVLGEGPMHPAMAFVGEQPGDQEDIEGRPFVGPAGQILNRAFAAAGISRKKTYLTNAVKHFKFEERGKRRIHKKPNATEITACKPWLEAEISAIRPKIIVCLGATAAQAVLGGDYRLTKERGTFTPHDWAPQVTATVHPSAILRAPDPERRSQMYADFVTDLKRVIQKVRRQ